MTDPIAAAEARWLSHDSDPPEPIDTLTAENKERWARERRESKRERILTELTFHLAAPYGSL